MVLVIAGARVLAFNLAQYMHPSGLTGTFMGPCFAGARVLAPQYICRTRVSAFYFQIEFGTITLTHPVWQEYSWSP